MLHAAEGELYREVLADACGLPVYLVAAHELSAQKDVRREWLAELGRAVGPPWRQDEKDATVCAWLALALPGPAGPEGHKQRPAGPEGHKPGRG